MTPIAFPIIMACLAVGGIMGLCLGLLLNRSQEKLQRKRFSTLQERVVDQLDQIQFRLDALSERLHSRSEGDQLAADKLLADRGKKSLRSGPPEAPD